MEHSTNPKSVAERERYHNDPDVYARINKRNKETRKNIRERNMHIVVHEYFIEKYGRGCTRCGHVGPYCHFHWAHWKRGTVPLDKHGKRRYVGKMVHWASAERIRAYLDDCRLLCALCHNEETSNEEDAKWAFM